MAIEYPEELVNVEAVCTWVVFESEDNGFTIAKFKHIGNQEGVPNNFTLKGTYVAVVGEKYTISGENEGTAQYPDTYKYTQAKRDIDFGSASKDDLITFMSAVTGPQLAVNLVNGIDNIIEVLDNGDINALMEVKGVGEKVAERLIDQYNQQSDIGPAIIFFAQYNIKDNSVRKIIKYFKDMDVAMKLVEENPYVISKVPGFGFKRADGAFLYKNQNDINASRDPRRVVAYVDFLFEEQMQLGNTWITPRQFIDSVMEYIPTADFKVAVEYINTSKDYYTITVGNNKRITSVKNMMMELDIAQTMIDMDQKAEPFKLERVEGIIQEVEMEQGFSFDEDQRKAIDEMLKHNVFLLQGGAGVGKTASVNAVARVMTENGYSIGQVALSGRAANNLQQVTGLPGRTIHSTIKFGTPNQYNPENPLHYDVILLDEISMVDSRIFLSLVEAMKQGSKIIMIGDAGQLDSIGAGVMRGFIGSNGVPTMTLTKIHRQAQDSAIVTHSVEIRKGKYHRDLKVKSDTSTIYGEKRDMEYIFVKNTAEDTIYEYVIDRFTKSIERYGVNGTQIIAPTRKFVSKMNEFAQIIANPYHPDKRQITVNDTYILREGDKVMNVKNDYTTKDIDGEKCPIFNGNTGTLLEIRTKGNAVHLIIRFDGVGTVVYPFSEKTCSIEHGYAITVHKVQGASIPSVIIALPFHFMLNSRELLYTAITRAKYNAVLVTSPKTLRSTIAKEDKRTQQTNLGLFLNNPEYWRSQLHKKIK